MTLNQNVLRPIITKKPLDYPLPKSNWYRLSNEKWASRPWTPEERKEAEKYRYKIVCDDR